MKIYIATGLERGDEAKALAAQLVELGHGLTYCWWEHGSVQADGPARIAEVAAAEVAGVRGAQLFVALLPGGRGTHTEFGIALASAIEDDERRNARNSYRPDSDARLVVLVGPTEDASGRTCAFYLHPRVSERFASVGELLAWLRGMARAA